MGNDPLFFNTIAGAILSASLLAMLTGFASQVLYSPGKLATPAYALAVAAPQATPAKVAVMAVHSSTAQISERQSSPQDLHTLYP